MLDETWKDMLGGRVHNCTHIKVSMYETLLVRARDIKTKRMPRLVRLEDMSFVPGSCYFGTYTDITFGIKQLFK